MSKLESNKKLVKMFREVIEDFADDIRREILPATGAEAEESKSNMYEFYLGDGATEVAGGNESGARKLFVKMLDTFLDEERAKATVTASGPARYEFKRDGSSKFWQIALAGAKFTVTWGKIGTPGTSQVKTWKDAATAKKEHDKLVAEKTKKGYKLVAAKSGAAKTPAKKAAKKPAKKPARR